MLKYEDISDAINECVILGKRSGDGIFLFKNRDRGFYPVTRVVRETEGDTEIVYLEDLDSGWKEGMNSHGISLVNSRFSAAKQWSKEPKDQYKSDPADEEKLKDLESEKEETVIDILRTCSTLEDAVEKAKEMRGVTLLTDGSRLVEIEATKDFGVEIRFGSALDPYTGQDYAVVRTNHGVLVPEGGLQERPGSTERASSEVRKIEAERYMAGRIHDPEDAFRIMSQQVFDASSENNVFRTTPLHVTGGQILLDPANMTFHYRPIAGSLEKFKGLVGDPEGKIKICLHT